MDAKKYSEQSQSYRRGYVEGYSAVSEHDVYLLKTGAADVREYERGFADGVAAKNEQTN